MEIRKQDIVIKLSLTLFALFFSIYNIFKKGHLMKTIIVKNFLTNSWLIRLQFTLHTGLFYFQGANIDHNIFETKSVLKLIFFRQYYGLLLMNNLLLFFFVVLTKNHLFVTQESLLHSALHLFSGFSDSGLFTLTRYTVVFIE